MNGAELKQLREELARMLARVDRLIGSADGAAASDDAELRERAAARAVRLRGRR